MSSSSKQLPLLPLVLDGVPPGLRQALAQEGISYVERAVARHAGQFVLFDSRSGRCRGLAADQIAIDIDSLRRAGGGDPFEDLLDERSAPHGYRIAGFEYREQIARVDKRQVRRRLMNRLREVLESRGGVWIKLAAYPFPYRSAFNLSSSYPVADEKLVDALDEVAGHEFATSHYLSGVALEAGSETATRLAGLDVGLLGRDAVIHDDVEDNINNLRHGAAILRRLGIEPRGYACPEGRFSQPLLSALEALGITHSTTVALGYDELPFFLGNSPVLQLPVHPLGVGQIPQSGPGSSQLDPGLVREMAITALNEYFGTLISSRYRAGEPVLLHRSATPRSPYAPGIVPSALAAAARCGALWRTTLSDWSRWWRVRSEVRLRVVADGEHFAISIEGRPSGDRFAAEYWRGEHVALVPLEGPSTRLSPGSLAFECRRSTPLPVPQRLDAGEPLRRIGRKRTSTPTSNDDSQIRALRNWMTRTLRRPWES